MLTQSLVILEPETLVIKLPSGRITGGGPITLSFLRQVLENGGIRQTAGKSVQSPCLGPIAGSKQVCVFGVDECVCPGWDVGGNLRSSTGF